MTYPSTDAKLELQTEAHLGEGPVWDEAEQKLYWVDLLSGNLHRYDPDDGNNISYDIGEHVGAAVLRESGGFVLALASGFAFYDPDTGRIEPISKPESDKPGNRFNDGKCDPSGRFWAGTMAYDLKEGAGSLYCLTRDLKVKRKLSGITISNGLAWNRAADRFFYIDTPTGNVYSFQYNDQSGEITDKQTVFHVENEMGYPDGMTIDTEDKLWVALYAGGKVIRIDPVAGEIIYEIHLPVPKVTSCTFGGKELNELYITTCREHMTDEEIEKFPLSGSLFKAKLPFKGLPAERYSA